MSWVILNVPEIDSIESFFEEYSGNKLHSALEISELSRNEIENFSIKIIRIYSKWKLNYLEKNVPGQIDLYKSKSNIWIDLSYMSWSKYFKCFWLDHILTQEAFEYLIIELGKNKYFYSKWLKKEIEDKFW